MTAQTYGHGDYRYRVDPDWGRGPDGVPAFGLVSMVTGDANDRVYVFQRAPDPLVLIFNADGRLVDQWGEGAFQHPHGIWMSPDQTLYCTDRDTHTVTQWTPDGQLLRTWGTPGRPGAPGEPFNEPSRAFVAESGDLYVSDGYGQHRVHRFAPDGTLRHSWGEPGTGPGQFGWPVHSVWVDPRGRVLVVDRENDRVQRFDAEGTYLDELGGLAMPQDVFITPDDTVFIAEGGGFISIMTLDDELLTRWGEKGDTPGQFAASPHSCWVDSQGSLYVGEVVAHNRFQKFVRV
jgi:sugar lactone lactonase YvrE